MRIVALLIALSAGAAHADEWTGTDKLLLGAAVGLLVVDWGQSRTIAREETLAYSTPACADPETRHHPLNGGCVPIRTRTRKETNPLLSEHPSVGDVDKYFAVATVGMIGMAYVLPPTYRRWFLGGIVILETAVVLRNHHIGVRVNF